MSWLDIFPDGTVFEMEGGTPVAAYETKGEVATLLRILPKTKAGTFKLAPPGKPQPEILVLDVITKQQAEAIYGNPIYDTELADLNACLKRFDITTPARLRHFLSQTAHESGGLRWLKELATGDDYEWRDDLGNTQSGDGRRFKGAGVIQLTGRANYQAFADFIGDARVMEGCDYVAATYPFTSAGFWWHNNGMNELCDQGATVEEITLRVNGGYNGLSDRQKYFDRATEVIS